MVQVAISGLAKSFGAVPVLRDVSLDVAAGELMAVLGASGSGKTTLLRLLCGFERPDAGTIALGGVTVAGPGAHVPPERRQIGYVAQDGALFPHLSVADNILFGLPRRRRAARHEAASWLERVGLPADYAARGPSELSGGEQQRVAIARALAPGPRLVLLDEPFSALDAGLRAETRSAVVSVLAQAGATAMLVTHDQAEALSTGNRVAVLRAGVLVQVAAPETLYRHPRDAALARLVGDAVLLPGIAHQGWVECRLGRLRLANGSVAEGAVQVLVRPEQIRLGEVAGSALQGRIEDVTFYGHDAGVRLVVETDGPSFGLLARVAGHAIPKPGCIAGIRVEGTVDTFGE